MLRGSGGNTTCNRAVQTEEGNQVQLVLFDLDTKSGEITPLGQFVNILDQVY